MKRTKLYFWLGLCFLILFSVFTVIVSTVGKGVVGEAGSVVGLSSVNKWFYNKIPLSETMDLISDLLMIVWFLIAGAFVLLGIIQWFERKKLKLVDVRFFSIIILYLLVIISYLLFEVLSINKRPVLIEGVLEVSYPSTHTLFAICVFGSFCLMVMELIKNKPIKMMLISAGLMFVVASVVVRMLSGMHWFTDVVGSVLLGVSLVFIAVFVNEILKQKTQKSPKNTEKPF